jgi:phosphorylated CTD-interacting factor 1
MATIAATRMRCETNDQRVIDCIVTAALCYNALVPRGQQLSIPSRAYDVMIQTYGATFEGFASPFNSQMMRYMIPRTHDDASLLSRSYCSIFPRIDAPFGSVGSFFDESSSANQLCNRVSVLNPPFIEKIMVAMVQKCIADLARATEPTRIFIIVPNWIDSAYFTMLTTCQYIERQLALPTDHHYIDAMHADLLVPMHIGQFLFVLSRNCHDTREHMYEDIIEAFQYSD